MVLCVVGLEAQAAWADEVSQRRGGWQQLVCHWLGTATLLEAWALASRWCAASLALSVCWLLTWVLNIVVDSRRRPAGTLVLMC